MVRECQSRNHEIRILFDAMRTWELRQPLEALFFHNFSCTYPQVVNSVWTTFQSFPTLFNTMGKLVEKF